MRLIISYFATLGILVFLNPQRFFPSVNHDVYVLILAPLIITFLNLKYVRTIIIDRYEYVQYPYLTNSHYKKCIYIFAIKTWLIVFIFLKMFDVFFIAPFSCMLWYFWVWMGIYLLIFMCIVKYFVDTLINNGRIDIDKIDVKEIKPRDLEQKKPKQRGMLKFFIVLSAVIIIYNFGLSKLKPAREILSYLGTKKDIQFGIETYNIKSDYQRNEKNIRVLFPSSLDESKRYPVVYVLPSEVRLWDDFGINGIREAAINDLADKYQAIFVYPSYDTMPWYGNNPNNKYINQESYLIEDVIPFVDSNFPTISSKEGRFLIGYSKSGCGAFSLLLRYPDMFNKAAAFDAPFMYDDIYTLGGGLVEVFANKNNFLKYYIPSLIEQRKNIFEGKEARFVIAGFYFSENHSEAMHYLMIKNNIPHFYDYNKYPRHSWSSGWFSRAINYMLTEDNLSY